MRKHGANLIMGTQSLASVRENLGDKMPGIILGGAQTVFALRMNGEDAELMARLEFSQEAGGPDQGTLHQQPQFHAWVSTVGEQGEPIAPFSMMIREPLDFDEGLAARAYEGRREYSTPVSQANADGTRSLTYLQDHFARLVSTGTAGNVQTPGNDAANESLPDSVAGQKVADELLKGTGEGDVDFITGEGLGPDAAAALEDLEDAISRMFDDE